MINLKDFLYHDMFDILACFHAVRFVIRSGLTMKCHGTYHDIIEWMNKTGYQRHEVTSAKLDFVMDVIEIQIR